MRGVILAGGSGSRLHPITQVTNKHLLPVYDKPMIYYPLETLKGFGITDIIIITGKEFAGDFTDLFGDGHRFGVNFTYKVQDGPLGIAHALGLVENIAKNEPVLAILGDNVYDLDKKEHQKIKEALDRFNANPDGAMVFLKKVKDPQRFGVAELDRKGNVLSIEEKPKKPRSKFAVTGLYLYDNSVFTKIRTLVPSQRGELEITDVNNAYLRDGKLKYHILKGEWTDAGTFESLHKANLLAKKKADKNKGRSDVQIHQA